MNFYDVISELNINLENRMFTVCEGVHAGEKMIVSAGETVWMSDDDGFFSLHASEALTAEDGTLTEIGGERVFAELLGNEKKMVICGAGHVSMPVIRIAKMMGFRVTAIDDRMQFVQNALDNGADEAVCSGFEEALSSIPGDPDTFFIIVTRGHLSDSECLLSIVKKPYAYIGMIGSRRKVGMVKQLLTDKGIAQEVIDSVHTPIGLDIGAETPEEIAVAIMAEIIEVKNKTRKSTGIPADIMKALLSDERGPAVLATIISKKGSSPRTAGTRMLVEEGGAITGTIGGGCAEATIITYASEVLRNLGDKEKHETEGPVIMYVDMTGKDVAESGMICGGAIEVLLETV
ncbi:MAG: XdhC family protein [Mogibacterium sp.]|nr:XdhC family protein [Mogibacterium sp.]